MKKRIALTTLLILMLSSACIPSSPTIPPEDELATVVAKTLTALPVLSVVSTNTPDILPTATRFNTPDGPYYTTTSAQNVNLRTQPGTLFPVSRVMAQGSRLQVLGLSPGGEWLYVLNDEGVGGWVDRTFVNDIPDGRFDLIQPQNSQVVSGRVLDANNSPVSGIGFAIEQGSKRTDAATDADGNFFAYLPGTTSGVWRVSFISIASTSNIMDSACLNDGNCGRTDPISIEVNLRTTAPLTFIFVGY